MNPKPEVSPDATGCATETLATRKLARSAASRVASLLVVLGCCLAAVQPALGTGYFQDITDQPLDLNGDGVPDLLLRLTANYTSPCGPWVWACNAWAFWTLAPTGTNAVLAPDESGTSCARGLEQGDVVSAAGIGSAGWWSLEQWVFLTSDSGAQFGPLVGRSQGYFGVRFAAADGVHFGWLRLDNDIHWGPRLGDFGFEPRPDAAVTVGDKPSAPPPLPNESVTLRPISTGDGIQFVVESRHWTNPASGLTGATARLAGMGGFEFLVDASVPPTSLGVSPVPLVDRALIPSNPQSPAVWRLDTNTLMLLDKRQEPGGAVVATGPLASGAGLTIAFRSAGGSPKGAGWLRLDTNAVCVGLVFDPAGYPAVGEPAVAFIAVSYVSVRSYSTDRLDLNADGLVDFVRRTFTSPMYSGVSSATAGELLLALGQNRILLTASDGPLPEGCIISTNASPPLKAVSPQVTLYQWEMDYHSPLGSPNYEGVFFNQNSALVGVCFDAADGSHYGWLRFAGSGSAVAESSYETRPGVPIVAGSHPPPLLEYRLSAGQLLFSWHPAETNYVLEASEVLQPPSWTIVPSTGHTAAVPLVGASRFYRLCRPSGL